ncbi:hypothetical protein [Pseudonocardia sp. GCM10023141]|uniref:hypothetical protein n=1 Tax=Pseudonocardia sp. GCM10023141 TaxID=3252653 RepID=UPI003616447C
MLIVYSFTGVAVSVRRWFEVSPEAVMEHGARIELALLAPQPHRGTESAAQQTVVDQPFWRADLFNRLDRPSDSFSAAHFHPRFDGVEPSDRVWSAALTADPWTWLTQQLENVEKLLIGAGLDPRIAEADADDLRAFAPRIVTSAQQFSPEHPLSRDEDFRLTRDASERVRRMLALIPDPTPAVLDHLRPWLERA